MSWLLANIVKKTFTIFNLASLFLSSLIKHKTEGPENWRATVSRICPHAVTTYTGHHAV